MKIAVGSDHAGFELKELVRPLLEEGGHEVVDVGTDSEESTDYPRHAADAARMVAEGEAERAVIVCGSGVGVSIVANKVDGVRAVNAHDAEEAEMSRRHNNANVLALAGRRLTPDEARPIVETFLATEFEGGRHERRVDQIAAVERGEEALESCSLPPGPSPWWASLWRLRPCVGIGVPALEERLRTTSSDDAIAEVPRRDRVRRAASLRRGRADISEPRGPACPRSRSATTASTRSRRPARPTAARGGS